jgi:hypothetical protein
VLRSRKSTNACVTRCGRVFTRAGVSSDTSLLHCYQGDRVIKGNGYIVSLYNFQGLFQIFAGSISLSTSQRIFRLPTLAILLNLILTITLLISPFGYSVA